MIIYMVRYKDSKAVVAIFDSPEKAKVFSEHRIEHPSHYEILSQDLAINPMYLK